MPTFEDTPTHSPAFKDVADSLINNHNTIPNFQNASDHSSLNGQKKSKKVKIPLSNLIGCPDTLIVPRYI